jgi:uncharacterized membrane protein YeiH
VGLSINYLEQLALNVCSSRADIAATLVFAVEGAMAAVNSNLNLIGITVCAFSTASGGGIIRDTLLGALPPAALRDWRYPTIALSAAVLVFFLHNYVRFIPWPSSPLQARKKPCFTK